MGKDGHHEHCQVQKKIPGNVSTLSVLVPASSARTEQLPSMQGRFGAWSQGEEIFFFYQKLNFFLLSWEKLPDPHGLGQASKENTPE